VYKFVSLVEQFLFEIVCERQAVTYPVPTEDHVKGTSLFLPWWKFVKGPSIYDVHMEGGGGVWLRWTPLDGGGQRHVDVHTDNF